MLYLELFVLTVVVCFIIDYSGFIVEMENIVSKIIKAPFVHIPKPFSCSLCMSWWCGVAFIFFTGQFTLFNLGAVVMLSVFSGCISDLLFLLRDMLKYIISWFGNKIY